MNAAIVIPKLGDIMEVGVLTHWLKEEGQWVVKGTPLFEMETDKVTTVVDSIGDGYLVREVPEGTEVPVGVVVAYLLDAEEMAQREGS